LNASPPTSITTLSLHDALPISGDTPDTSMRWVNQFTHTRRLRTPEDKEVVTPNNDTLFTNAWLDLADGPVVIQVPDMGSRYWVRSEEHTSELQSRENLVCRLLL